MEWKTPKCFIGLILFPVTFLQVLFISEALSMDTFSAADKPMTILVSVSS